MHCEIVSPPWPRMWVTVTRIFKSRCGRNPISRRSRIWPECIVFRLGPKRAAFIYFGGQRVAQDRPRLGIERTSAGALCPQKRSFFHFRVKSSFLQMPGGRVGAERLDQTPPHWGWEPAVWRLTWEPTPWPPLYWLCWPYWTMRISRYWAGRISVDYWITVRFCFVFPVICINKPCEVALN